MSDVKKEVGIIGQKYEDRNSGKTGVLESRDEKRKTLMMIGEDEKGFVVSYSSFRSRILPRWSATRSARPPSTPFTMRLRKATM